MTSRPVPIFYEDEFGEVRQFGPHELLVACIADVREQNLWDLRPQFEAIPKKGDANLLRACQQDVPDMPDSLIFAVFDSDKLHRLLCKSGRPSDADLEAELRRLCPDERLHIFLLVQNTETVVDAVADCLGVPRPMKRKLLRDRLLTRAARGPRQHRDCARQAVPSFDECVRRIAELSRQSRQSRQSR